MLNDFIEKAPKTVVETKDITFDDGATNQMGEMSAKLLLGARAPIVVDENTLSAAGEEVVASPKAVGAELTQEPYIFPGKPTLYGDYRNIEILYKYIEPLENTAVCSIGAGTFNDIAKPASDGLSRLYINVYTATSVDGFAVFGTSISRGDFKITHSYPGPASLVADNDVVYNASKRLTITRYDDLIEKTPAGADWILADILGIEPTNEYVRSMAQGLLRGFLANPEAIENGDKKATEGPMEGNFMPGLAMQAGQSSRSASDAGHQFSHVWEVEGHGLGWELPFSHGSKIRAGTVASCAIWEEFLKMEAEDFDADHVLAAVKSPKQVESQVHAALKSRMQEGAARHSFKKRVKDEEFVARIELLKEKWSELRKRLRAQLMALEEVMDHLKTVGTLYHSELIEIDWGRFRETHFRVQMVRDCYTVLDTLIDLGVYDTVVEKLFSPEGFWGRHRRPAE